MRSCGVGPVGDCGYAAPVPCCVLVTLHGVGTRECLSAGAHEGTFARVTSLMDAQVVASSESGATFFTGERFQRPSSAASVTGAVAMVMTVVVATTIVTMVIQRRRFDVVVVGDVGD